MALIAQGMTPERADAVKLGMTVFPTVERITGQAPRPYAEWVNAHLDAFR